MFCSLDNFDLSYEKLERAHRSERVYGLVLQCAYDLGDTEKMDLIFSEAIQYEHFPYQHASHPDQVDLDG